MKWIILTVAFGITLLLLFSYHPRTSLKPENVLQTPQFIEILKKVSFYFDQHPDSHVPTMEDLLNKKVISKNDYDYLTNNRIRYNDPASAGPYDNTISLFDRDNEDCTSSHILVMVADTSDPEITHSGTIDSLGGYVGEWFTFQSDNKTIFVHNENQLYYFTLSYNNNEYWDHQHRISIHLNDEKLKLAGKLKSQIDQYHLACWHCPSGTPGDITVILPDDALIITSFCHDILTQIYDVQPNDIILFMADGFRFQNNAEAKSTSHP